MSFHPHMTAPGSGFGHMKFMKDMKGMMNMMEQLKKHNKDGEVSVHGPGDLGAILGVGDGGGPALARDRGPA